MIYLLILTAFLYVSCNTAAILAAQKKEIQLYELENTDTLLDIGCGNAYFDRQISNYYPNVFFVLEDLPVLEYHTKKGQPETKSLYPTVEEVQKNFRNSKKFPGIRDRFKLVIGFEDSIPLTSDAFARILCRRTLHEFKKKEKMVAEIRRLLKQNGKLTIVERLSKYSGERDPYCGNQYMTKDEIIQLLSPLRFASESIAYYKSGELHILNFEK